MFDIGFMELLVVGVLGLLVLGPERLPKAARTLGQVIGRVRRSVANIQEDLERHARTEELKEKLRNPAATFLDQDILNPSAMREPKTDNAESSHTPPSDNDTSVADASTSKTANSETETAREDTHK